MALTICICASSMPTCSSVGAIRTISVVHGGKSFITALRVRRSSTGLISRAADRPIDRSLTFTLPVPATARRTGHSGTHRHGKKADGDCPIVPTECDRSGKRIRVGLRLADDPLQILLARQLEESLPAAVQVLHFKDFLRTCAGGSKRIHGRSTRPANAHNKATTSAT